ncbi:PilN domain-containing protein [Ureibacillus chungkukjangi]|uniref:Tfp pilus assembly protein PilN n=1 Tax=Ureibacillus chungkukjangi TaxID=1202712 RepID=A0A318TDA0_9BACL|nr:malate synthase [Ureibacillus chungkukjangi]PYF02861.1 Tfp pilus assembly protein PilN [Ureibacillus chungkukjangi]
MIPDINLIPRLERNQQGSRLLYSLLAIITLLVLSLFVWQYFSANAEIADLQSKEANLMAQRDQLAADLTNLQPSSQGSLEQSLQFIERVSYPISPLMDEIQALQPSNSYLRNYNFSPESVSISIDFETLSDVSTYVSRLSNSSYFIDGQVLSITNSGLGEELGTENETNFDVIPRQSVEITLLIDETYLSTGGVQ